MKAHRMDNDGHAGLRHMVRPLHSYPASVALAQIWLNPLWVLGPCTRHAALYRWLLCNSGL